RADIVATDNRGTVRADTHQPERTNGRTFTPRPGTGSASGHGRADKRPQAPAGRFRDLRAHVGNDGTVPRLSEIGGVAWEIVRTFTGRAPVADNVRARRGCGHVRRIGNRCGVRDDIGQACGHTFGTLGNINPGLPDVTGQ